MSAISATRMLNPYMGQVVTADGHTFEVKPDLCVAGLLLVYRTDEPTVRAWAWPTPLEIGTAIEWITDYLHDNT